MCVGFGLIVARRAGLRQRGRSGASSSAVQALRSTWPDPAASWGNQRRASGPALVIGTDSMTMQRHSMPEPTLPSRSHFTACGGSAGLALTMRSVASHSAAIRVESTAGRAFALALRALGVT
jgi:hypothetical protein